MGFLPYGDRHRAQRRMMGQVFNSNAIKVFRPFQEEQVKIFLKNILDDDSTYIDSVKL